MSAHTDTTTGDRRVRRRHVAFNASKLGFPHYGFHGRGEYRITAEYPSASDPRVRHSVVLRLDGSVVSHGESCRHHAAPGACWHTQIEHTREMVREWHRRMFRGETSAFLVRRDHELARQGALDAAERLELDALADILGERYLAKYGPAGEGAA